MEVHLNICTQNGVFSGKWDSNDLYNVRCWFPTSYADLYFIPCLYGWMNNHIITVLEYVLLICVDDLFTKSFAFLVANLDFEHQKEVVGSSAKSKGCNKICKRRWSNMFQFQMCWFTWVSDDFNQEQHGQHENFLEFISSNVPLVQQAHNPRMCILCMQPNWHCLVHPWPGKLMIFHDGKNPRSHLPNKSVLRFRGSGSKPTVLMICSYPPEV